HIFTASRPWRNGKPWPWSTDISGRRFQRVLCRKRDIAPLGPTRPTGQAHPHGYLQIVVSHFSFLAHNGRRIDQLPFVPPRGARVFRLPLKKTFCPRRNLQKHIFCSCRYSVHIGHGRFGAMK
ncbi:MAG: hypothetical protein E5X49_32825, partial [Mesorhizobium sp.]